MPWQSKYHKYDRNMGKIRYKSTYECTLLHTYHIYHICCVTEAFENPQKLFAHKQPQSKHIQKITVRCKRIYKQERTHSVPYTAPKSGETILESTYLHRSDQMCRHSNVFVCCLWMHVIAHPPAVGFGVCGVFLFVGGVGCLWNEILFFFYL